MRRSPWRENGPRPFHAGDGHVRQGGGSPERRPSPLLGRPLSMLAEVWGQGPQPRRASCGGGRAYQEEVPGAAVAGRPRGDVLVEEAFLQGGKSPAGAAQKGQVLGWRRCCLDAAASSEASGTYVGKADAATGWGGVSVARAGKAITKAMIVGGARGRGTAPQRPASALPVAPDLLRATKKDQVTRTAASTLPVRKYPAEQTHRK